MERCSLCDCLGHLAKDCSRVALCYKCNKYGHFARECQESLSQGLSFSTYYNCKKLGHYAKDCQTACHINGTGTTSKMTSEIISIDDDEEEDVEVVFTNLKKSHVYRNLMCQKISQEIELLQAIYKEPIPNEFNEFKEQAKRLGFEFGDDVIQSAWTRIMKKYASKLASFPSNTAPVCRVKPISVSNLPDSSETSKEPRAIPVALLLNSSVRDGNLPEERKEYSIEPVKLVGTIEIDSDDESSNRDPIYNKKCKKRQRETYVCSSDLYEGGLSKNMSEELDEIQISLVSALSESAIPEKNQSSDKKKVSREYSPKFHPSSKKCVFENSSLIVEVADNQVLASESKHNKTESAGKVIVPCDNRCSKNLKRGTDVLKSSLVEESLSKRKLKESDKVPDSVVSPLSQSYIDCLISGQYLFLGDKRAVTQKCAKKPKQVVSVDSQKTGSPAIAKSHVGVKAKIVRTKKIVRTPTKSKKEPNIVIKEMSEAEFKEFKAEQKRIKFQERKSFDLEQLQKVHDRLVEVIIPKYHKKNPNVKS